jgi:hypothetical protein
MVTKIKWLFADAKKLGYKGSFGHMARYVAHVRSIVRAHGSPAPAEHTIRSLPLDPASGSRISPVVAAATADRAPGGNAHGLEGGCAPNNFEQIGR